METPRRRERDERRKFKDLGSLQRMGYALGHGAGGAFHDTVNVVDPKVTRPGTSYDKNSGDRIVPRDNNESGPMVREDIAAGNRKAHDAWVENTNKQKREKGKTKIVRIDSNPTREEGVEDAEVVDDPRARVKRRR
jgi:hypothetical protein